MVETILSSAIFSNIILPFLLVFTLLFAILEKTKILGDGKKQINAITSLVIGLIVISYSYAVGVISKLMPFLAVSAVVILVFMILMGFVTGSGELKPGLKITFGILVGLGLIIAVLWATGTLGYVYSNLFTGSSAGSIWTNVLFIALIGGAIALVLSTSKGGGGGGKT